MSDQFSANAIAAIMPNLNLTLPYFGEVNIERIVAATIVFLALTVSFWLLRVIVLNNAKKLANLTSGTLDDVIVVAIQNIRAWVYTLIALFASLKFFSLPVVVDKTITAVFFFVIVWQTIEVVTSLIKYFVSTFLEKDEDGDGVVDPNSANASHMVTLLSRIVLWSLGILFILSNLGIEVGSLVAGLGIGGIAIAFALQGVLGDLFASFSLYFDKPFKIGDFIKIGEDSGTVEKIGIKTTRIRTLQGEQLVVSNTNLTAARVQNFKKMKERRVVSKFGITYETPHERVKEVPNIVTSIFADLDGCRLDRIHFTSFGDSALLFEAVYYIESPDQVDYLNLQQAFNFELMKRFSDVSIEFAYPTQTIYTKSLN